MWIEGRSPAQLARILGVSESTVKRWADSGHLRAERTIGGHRKIAIPDLVAFLRKTGRPVPSLEALGVLAPDTRARQPEPVTAEALAGLLVRGDTQVARRALLDQFRQGRHLVEMLDGLVAPAMAQVGAQWADGTIDVYQEHLATMRAWTILVELRELLPIPAESAPLALGGTPEGDPYLLPTFMAELVLAELGWRTLNLGPHTPLPSLLRAVARHAPRLVWLSVTSSQVRPDFFRDYPRLFEAAEARGAAVIVGGQGLSAELQNQLVATAFGTRLAHLRAFARSLTP